MIYRGGAEGAEKVEGGDGLFVKFMRRYVFPIAITLFLVALAYWMVLFGLDQRRVHYRAYANEENDVAALSRHPGVLYRSGQQAWAGLNPGDAAALFRKVVARNPLHMDAWLKLAEAEAEAGNAATARKIAAFCDARTGQVLRWKRAHTLLAHELGQEAIFKNNLNYMVGRKKWLSELFYLLNIHTNNQTDRALSLLTANNRPAYLESLIGWKKEAAAQTVWAAIEAEGSVSDVLLEKYVHFLISQKRVAPAAVLWQQHSGASGMTNPGFEKAISGMGFGWRMYQPKGEKRWQGRRAFGQGHQQAHALRVSFHGRDNLAWHHIYQVVPVTPEKPHRLTFWWKCKGISTDQGPFVEIYGFDAKGLYRKSAMALGSFTWVKETVVFTPPADCHAVSVRLRRNESLRFDSKIQGVLWVDTFKLEQINKDSDET